MGKTKILVVEDEPKMQRNLVRLLNLEGYEVAQASNGIEALNLLKKFLPDLILCDVMMPKMDGYEVLKALRADPQMASIPFVFLTARGEKDDMREGMNFGADDYIMKPVTRNHLLHALTTRLKRRRELQMGPVDMAQMEPSILEGLGLTPREAELLFWVAQGKSNLAICEILTMKLFTVKKHLENIFTKLGVENRTNAASLALEAAQKYRSSASLS